MARSAEARDCFHVSSEGFERRVELVAGGEPRATVIFGSSAGTGRAYARAAGHDTIYEVEFALWHASVNPQKWYDTRVAGLDPSAVQKAELPDFALKRAGEGQWQVDNDGDASAEASQSGKAVNLVRRLAQPRIEGVARAEPPEGDPMFHYALTTTDGKTVRFRYFAGSGENAKPRLFRDDQPWRYTVAPKRLAELRKNSPDKLLAAKDQEGGETAAADGQSESGSES